MSGTFLCSEQSVLRSSKGTAERGDRVGHSHRAGEHRSGTALRLRDRDLRLSRTFLMKTETLKALSKCLVRKVPEEVTCVLNWDGADLQATGGRTFPAGAKLGQRQEDSRHPGELVVSGNAPWPGLGFLLCGEGARTFRAGRRKHLCKLLGSPRARHLSPSGPVPSCLSLTPWQVRGEGVPVAHCLPKSLSFPMCGECGELS